MSLSREVSWEGEIDGPGKADRVAVVGVHKEKEKGIMTISPQYKDIINKPEPKVRFIVF